MSHYTIEASINCLPWNSVIVQANICLRHEFKIVTGDLEAIQISGLFSKVALIGNNSKTHLFKQYVIKIN